MQPVLAQAQQFCGNSRELIDNLEKAGYISLLTARAESNIQVIIWAHPDSKRMLVIAAPIVPDGIPEKMCIQERFPEFILNKEGLNNFLGKPA